MRILFLLLISISSFAQIQAITGTASRGSIDVAAIVEAFQTRVEADGGTFEAGCLTESVGGLYSVGFFDDATFILTADGYKTSKIYAIKPTSGAGDLAFSRGSAAVRKFSTVETLSSNVPRLDYSYDCPALLLEASKENLLHRSEEFDHADWIKTNATISANATTAPDGTSTADKIVEATGTAAHGVRQNLTKAASALRYVLQYYIKPAGRDWARITASDGGSNAVVGWFNLSTGVKGSAETLGTNFIMHSYDMLPAGNGWYLCYISFTTNTGTTLASFCHPATDDLVTTFAGNTSNGVYVWGAKVIQSQGALPDSYIHTPTVAATRSSDAVTTLTSVSSLIGQTEGTIYLDLKSWADGTQKSFSISDGTTDNRVSVNLTSTNTISTTVVNATSTQASIANTRFRSNQEYKIAVTYQSNKVALFVNGEKIGEDLSVTVPACSVIDFGDGSGANDLYGNISTIGLLPSAISDGAAQALTDGPELTEFEDFLTRIPPTRLSPNDPVIVNGGTYQNLCPGGIVTDPNNSAQSIFYLGEFFGSTTVGARIGYHLLDNADPYDLGARVGTIMTGTPSTDDQNGVRFGCAVVHPSNGQIWYYYVGVDASYEWRIFRATSTDGLTFTKQGEVLDFDGITEFSVSDPSIIIDEDGTWWMMYTCWDGLTPPLPNNNPGESKVGIRLAHSSDGITWTKTGTTLIALGSNGSFDDNNAEGGQMLIVGDKAVILYNANDGSRWYIGIAYRPLSDINGKFIKIGKYFAPETVSEWDDGIVAVPYVHEFPSGKVMYYQASSFTVGDSDDIDVGASDLLVVNGIGLMPFFVYRRKREQIKIAA